MNIHQFNGHSPAPWKNEHGNIWAANGKQLADTVLDMVIPQDEAYANSRLMAAAPDLLAHLIDEREEVKRLNQYIALLHETLEEEHFVLSEEFNAKAETIFPDVEDEE